MAKFGHIELVYYSLAIPAKSITKWLALDIFGGVISATTDDGQRRGLRCPLSDKCIDDRRINGITYQPS
jgi:hypothetical protein